MKRIIWVVLGIVLLAGISAELVLLDRRARSIEAAIRAIQDQQSNIRWDQYASDIMSNTDFVTPDVGVIQFLKRGHSIELESVNYTQDGLFLSGNLGNPTNLTISNLTLVFSARPYFTDEMKAKWETMHLAFAWWPDEWNIGTGQTSVIPVIPPKTRFPFSVTIPNVKQTKDNIHIAVTFSGERYYY